MKSAAKAIPLIWGSAIFIGSVFSGCSTAEKSRPEDSIRSIMSDVDSLVGKSEYLATPYVTAGDRLYMIGTQDGKFPDLGWHVAGEMGGVWDHPIKLLDGFTAAIVLDGKTWCLDQADAFVNYPFANKHIFHVAGTGLRIERFQYVPDGQEAVLVEYTLINESAQNKKIDFQWTALTDLRPTWLGNEPA